MINFNIYPELTWGRKYYYVKVKVFETRKEMNSDMKNLCFPHGRDTQGQCSGHEVRKNGKLTGQFATIWLNKKDLNINGEIVPHECVHASMRHIRNRKIDLSNMDGEEVLAYCVGSMANQITSKLIKHGIYK